MTTGTDEQREADIARDITRPHLAFVPMIAAFAALAAACGSAGSGSRTSIDSIAPTSAATPASSVTSIGSTTIPSTTGPSTPPSTAGPSTAGPSTTRSPTASPSTEPERPSGFGDWPVPSEPAPSLAELPHLLPGEPIAVADDVVRSEGDSDVEPDRIDYTQIFAAAEGGSMLLVQSNPDQAAFTPDEQRSDVAVAGWGDAYFSRSAPRFANLTLVEGDGHLALNGRGISEDDVLAAARSLQRRPGGAPGWEIAALPAGMLPIHEGWANGPTFRELDWYAGQALVAELSIVGGLPDVIDPQTTGDRGVTITEVSGVDALAVENSDFDGPPISLITWSPQPEIVVYFGMQAPLDEALSVARSVRAVDVDTWEAASRLPVVPLDGCSSFRC